MLNLAKLCADSHQISKDAGWLDSPRTNDQIVNLFVTEVSEGFEEDRGNRSLTEVYYECKFELPGTDGNPATTEKRILTKHQLFGETGEDPADFAAMFGGVTPKLKEAKPCGIPIELADWIIRVAQYCGTEGSTEALVDAYENAKPEKNPTFSKLCLELTVASVHAYNGDDPPLDVYILGEAIVAIEEFCSENGIDLQGAITEKEAFNKTRAYRHGGKKC